MSDEPDTPVELPDGWLIADRVARACAQFPELVAVDDDGSHWTFTELDRCVTESVASLRDAGVSPGDVVALAMSRRPPTVVALLALWALGACVALVDSTLPKAVRRAQVAASGADWWHDGSVPSRREADPVPHALAGRCGHVLFTSGSSGSPAAVGVRATALLAGLDWYLDAFGTGPGDRVAWLSGLGHDPVLRDLLVPLLCGATLVVPPAEALAAPLDLAECLHASDCTVLHCTPALAELLIAGAGPTTLGSLRLVVSGGAALSVGTARALRAIAPTVTLVNAYGSTETPQIVACTVIGPGEQPAYLDGAAQNTVPIGSGVAGAVLSLEHDGEIVMHSGRLAEGYLVLGPGFMEPDRSSGLRGFRTGDLARRTPYGVEVIGRRDRRISINGLRIAPEEIEHAARAHPLVLDARAGLYRGPAGELVELSVAHWPGEAPASGELRRFLRERLHAGAVPARIRITSALEFDRNHKTAFGRPGPPDLETNHAAK